MEQPSILEADIDIFLGMNGIGDRWPTVPVIDCFGNLTIFVNRALGRALGRATSRVH